MGTVWWQVTDVSRDIREVEDRLDMAEKEVVKLSTQPVTAAPANIDPTEPQVQLKHVVSQGTDELVIKDFFTRSHTLLGDLEGGVRKGPRT